MFDAILTFIYVGSCAFAIIQGKQKIYVFIALFLALIFQYVLEFSDIAKIIAAVIFVSYFVFPNVSKYLKLPRKTTKFAKDTPAEPPYEEYKPSAKSSKNTPNFEATPESVYQEFQEFTRRQRNKSGRNNSSSKTSHVHEKTKQAVQK